MLVEIASPLAPGSALDLGCGRGGDTVWLAQRGWQVTAVDIAATAVREVGDLAHRLGLGDTVVTEQHDLARTFPTGEFDLVSAIYLHTPFTLARHHVLRTAAHALRDGGLLLVVDHGSTSPWSWNTDPDATYPTATDVAVELALDPDQWSVLHADSPRRQATGPGGETATVTDHVLLLRRSHR